MERYTARILKLFVVLILVLSATAIAQDKRIVVEPENIQLQVSEEIEIKGYVVDENGEVLPDTVSFFTRGRAARRALSFSEDGMMKAHSPGTFGVQARSFGDEPMSYNFEVNVAFPPITSIGFARNEFLPLKGTNFPFRVIAKDLTGEIREDVEIRLTSSDESIVSVDEFHNVYLHEVGEVDLVASVENMKGTYVMRVLENPTRSIELNHNYENKTVRTGDVISFVGTPQDENGNAIEKAAMSYSYIAQPDDQLGQGASALIEQDGKFVANKPGVYTVMARSGNHFAETTFRVVSRNVQQPLTVVGKGIVPDVKTSDLWVWEGVDGRDYAVTGTWGARGEAFFWDVTDPSNIHTIDTVTVDARTVNDVKVSEDGTIAVITREGASNRKNGIIILDVTDPSNVKILSEYTDGLTGGVHNSFIYEDHVYAVNNGRKYDIINIEDPANPYTVSVVELDTPGHAIHDVWIEDGIAYSSNWSDGILAVDIGSNSSADMPGAGGSPENPVKLGSYTYPSGWNHAAFPFKSKSTGDFYVAGGDEAFPYGLNFDGPNRAAGWIHFVKFDGWDNPEEVARYQVPEAGSHNYWIEDDVLYAAFYNGGLRVVDISGELMGDLYEQGREIALFIPTDKNAAIPNAAFTWGPQPYKGHIFFSDWNSGIWAVKLGDANSNGTD